MLKRAKIKRRTNKYKRKAKIYKKKYKIMHPRKDKKDWLRCARGRKEFLWGLKHNPCADCQKNYPAPAMDFDHINSHSRYNNMSALGYKDKVKELSKCQLVCSNCHRIRTWKRANGYTLSIRNSQLFC